MKLDSMVTDSKMDDILEKITPDEIMSFRRLEGGDGSKPPLLTVEVDEDRYLEFVKMTDATPSKTQTSFWNRNPALFINAYDKAPSWQSQDVTCYVGIWANVGEEV